jgi:hypothetical protein
MFQFVINWIRSKERYVQGRRRICEITPEQRDKIPEYQQKWIHIAQYGIENNAETIEQAIGDAYGAIGLRPPQVKSFQSPHSLLTNFNINQENWAERLTTRLNVPVVIVFAIWLLVSFPLWVCSFFVALPTVIQWFFSSTIPLKILLVSSGAIGLWISSWPPEAETHEDSFTFLGSLSLATSFIILLIYIFILAPLAVWLNYGQNPLFALAYIFGPCSIGLFHWLQEGWIEVSWKRLLDKQLKLNIHPQIYTQVEQAFITPSLEHWESVGKLIISGTSTSSAPLITEHRIDIWDWITWCSRVDFCISELGCECNTLLWNSIQVLVSSCSTILPRESFCSISDRPTQISVDEQQRLHAESKSAVAFADGIGAYFIHGVQLPDEYGELHPHQWRSEWVLTETNAERRRILIQGIGYGRLCQELNTKTIDTWREYTLLWVEVPTLAYVNNQQVKEDAMLLLKMTCPSTNHIHVLRVPPNTGSARAAAKWVNWDIDPEAFAIES